MAWPDTEEPQQQPEDQNAPMAQPSPRPMPANQFDAAFRPDAMPGESYDEHSARLEKLTAMGAIGRPDGMTDEQATRLNASVAENGIRDAERQQAAAEKEMQRQGALQQRDADRQAKAADAEQKKAAAGYLKMMKDAGAVTEIAPDGKESIKSDAQGNPIYTPAIVSPVHGHPETGAPVVDVRDAAGKVSKQDAVKLGKVHIDPATGMRFTREGGEYKEWGLDQDTVARHELTNTRADLLNQAAQDELAIRNMRRDFSDPGGLQEQHAEAARPIREMERNIKTTTRNLEKQVAVLKASNASPETIQATMSQLEDTKTLEALKDKYDAALPDYLPIKAQHDAAKKAVNDAERARDEKRLRADVIASDLIANRVARQHGSGADMGTPPQAAARNIVANAAKDMQAAGESGGAEAARPVAARAKAVSESLSMWEQTKATLEAATQAYKAGSMERGARGENIQRPTEEAGVEPVASPIAKAVRAAAEKHYKAANELQKATLDPGQWTVDAQQGVSGADIAREAAGAAAAGTSHVDGAINALEAASTSGITLVDGQKISDVLKTLKTARAVHEPAINALLPTVMWEQGQGAAIREVQQMRDLAPGLMAGLAGQGAGIGTVGPQGRPMGFESADETATRQFREVQQMRDLAPGLMAGLAGQGAGIGTVGPQGRPMGFESDAETKARKDRAILDFDPQLARQRSEGMMNELQRMGLFASGFGGTSQTAEEKQASEAAFKRLSPADQQRARGMIEELSRIPGEQSDHDWATGATQQQAVRDAKAGKKLYTVTKSKPAEPAPGDAEAEDLQRRGFAFQNGAWVQVRENEAPIRGGGVEDIFAPKPKAENDLGAINRAWAEKHPGADQPDFGITRPVDALNQAVSDGVLPEPSKEVRAAIEHRQELINSNGSKIAALLKGSSDAATFLGAAIPAGGAASETGLLAIPIGFFAGAGAVKVKDKLLGEWAKTNATIADWMESAEVHPYWRLAGDLGVNVAGLPKGLMKAAGGGLESLAGKAAKASAVPGSSVNEVRASLLNAEQLAGAGVKVSPAVVSDIYSRSANLLDRMGKAMSSGGGGVASTFQNFSRMAETMQRMGSGRGAVAAAIAGRIGVGAGSMVAIGAGLRALTGDEQTVEGSMVDAFLGMVNSGHGLSQKTYTRKDIGDIFLRGFAHDLTQKPLGEALTGDELAGLAKFKENNDFTFESKHGAPLTPEETEIYNALVTKAKAGIADGTLQPDPKTWNATAKQMLRAGRSMGLHGLELTPERGTTGKEVSGDGGGPAPSNPSAPSGGSAGMSPNPVSGTAEPTGSDSSRALVTAKAEADAEAARLDAAKKQTGNLPEQAAAADAAIVANAKAEHAAGVALTPSANTVQRVAGITGQTRQAVTVALAQNPHAGAVAITLGEQMGGALVSPAQYDAAQKAMAADPQFEGNPELAQVALHRMLGAKAIDLLEKAATGNVDGLTPELTAGFQRLGYLAPASDGGLVVTAPGRTLLSAATRAAIAKQPGNFKVDSSTDTAISDADHAKGLDAAAAAAAGREVSRGDAETRSGGAVSGGISQTQGGAEAARVAHTHEAAGSSPAPATNPLAPAGQAVVSSGRNENPPASATQGADTGVARVQGGRGDAAPAAGTAAGSAPATDSQAGGTGGGVAGGAAVGAVGTDRGNQAGGTGGGAVSTGSGKFHSGLGTEGRAGKRLAALERAGVKVVQSDGATQARLNDDGTTSIEINPANYSNPELADSAVDEEISHHFDHEVLVDEWRAAVAAGKFKGTATEYRAKRTAEILDDLQTRIAGIADPSERAAAEEAVVSAFNVYFGKLKSDIPLATTIGDALQQIESGVKMGPPTKDGVQYYASLFSYAMELGRMLDQAQRRGRITEETHDVVRKGKIGQWVRAAFEAIKRFAAKLLDMGHPLHASEIAKFAREARAKMKAWFEKGGTDTEGEAVEAETSNVQRPTSNVQGAEPASAPLGDAITLGGREIALGHDWEAADQSGTDVYRGRWALVPMKLLDVQTQTGDAQNRIDRRETGRAGREEMKRNLRAENVRLKWGSSPGIDTGAPIMEPDGTVVAGNNRTMALQEMQDEQGDKASVYDAGARAMAARLGLDPKAFDGEPVALVRVAEPGLKTGKFVEQSNKAAVEQLSAADKAHADRRALASPGLLDTLDPLENGSFNTEFLTAFDKSLGSPKELRKPDGTLDLTATEKRAQAALLAHLLGKGSDTLLVSLMSNMEKPGIRQVVSALAKVGPALLNIESIAPERTILPHVGQALSMLVDFRRAKDAGQVKTVADWKAQGTLFAEDGQAMDPLTERILDSMASAKSPKSLADRFLKYAKAVEEYDPAQGALFGSVEPVASDYFAGQPGMKLDADGSENAGLWDIANAEPLEAKPVPEAERKKWEKVYRTLFALQREGPLKPAQQAMFDRAERVLGQRLLFGDADVKGTKGLESFKARWSSGGLKGTTDLSGDLFDEKAEGRVGKFAPGAAQGSLFAKHDPDQMGFSGDFATAGLDLWKRAGLAKAGPKADPGQLDLWAQQGGNVQRPTSNVQRPTEEVPTSTPAAAPTWELPFVLPEAVKPKVGDSAKTLAGKQRAANHLAAAHAAKAADVNDDAGEELKYNRRGRVMTGMKWQDFAALNPTLRTREATKAKVYPRPDYAQMIAGGMADIPAHFVKQVYDSMAATPQVRGELKDEDIQRYITGVNRVMEGALRWAGDKEAVGRWAQSQMPGAGPRSILDEMRAPKGLLESVYPGGDWKAHRDELIAIGGNKVLAALQPSRQEAMKATKDIKAGWPAAQESWQKQGWKVVKTSDAVKVGEGFDYSSKGASQERTPVFFARVLDRMGESFLTRAEAEAHIAGMKPALLLGKYGRIEGQFDTEEQAAEAARLKVKRDGKKTVSEKGTSVAVARRTGPEHRLAGEDIPTQKLVEAFGFRGVNFGNWMKGDSNARERQLHLNHAYDAFMDLAQVLGVPPQAMSLNGMLGIAFGAQGNGKHAAHFVPGLNEINLTREGGAGALAHEWGHGLDHYFAMLAGREREGDPYLSEKVGGAPASGMVDRIVDGKRQQVRAFAEELRPEIVAKFKAIVQAMNQRQETPEEVANRAAAQVAASKRGVESWLKSVAADATRAKVSEADFNRLADRIRAGDLGEGKVSAGNFAFSPVVDEVRDLFKKATGRVYSMDQSRGLQNSADWLKRQLEQKQGAEDHKPQMVSTDYQKASAEEDKGKGGKGYWNTTVEKFARAFDAFVTDEVKAKAQKNTYLSGIEAIAPQGTERTVIGQAFRDLVGTLKTRETERGTALFAKPEEKEPRKLDEPAEDGHGGGHERDIAARVEKALADLSRGEGGVSQDAYADVARNAGPIAEKQGVSREDGERLALIQWAVRNKRVIPPAKFANRAGDDGGVEHKVFYKEFGDRVGKVTLDKPQYPLEYLKRMALSDAVFASGEKLEGITFHPGSRRLALVISQDFVKGEHPTEPEIDAWMAARGFPKASDKTHGFYVGHGLVVADASPKNWIKNPQTGTLTPIDIRVAEHSAEQSQPFAKPEETGDELPDARVKDEGLKKVPKSSTQLTLNAEQAKPFLKFIQSIPEGEIYSKADKDGKEDYGRETEPHVTALYGLLNHDPVAASAAIAGSGPVTVKLGKLGMFESKDYDVLKVNVEGDSLHALNRRLRSQPYYSDYDDYKPHLTLAYLKKGEAKKYVGMDPFAGKQLTFDSVTFSPPSDGGLRDVIGKPEMPLNGGKLRPLGELKGEAGGAVVDFVAPKLKAGMAALATIGRVARGVEPTKPMRDLSQMGDDVLDQAVQHVGARSYAPVLVKSFMQDIFGPALGNAAFVKRVGDVIVMDNLLGGVDAMKVVLAKLKAKGAVAVMAPPAAKTGTLPGFPVPTGATEDQRTAAEKAQTTILEKKIADVEQSQPLDGMDVLVKDALAEPEIAAAIAQYRKVVMPAMDELYKEIKKVDPLAQLATRGRHFGARVNLMTKKQEQRMKEWLDPDKPMPQVGAGNASSYRNPDVKRDKFDRPADLTAEYSDNLEMMLLNSFGPRINEVTKERLYTALEKSGWGVVQKDGEDPATEIHGEETKPLSFTRYVTNPWGETTRATVLMDVPASKVETLRTVLATDMIPNQNPVAKALTGVQVLGIADATAHIKNQMSVVTHALGRDKNWQAVLSRLPFLGQMQAFVEIRSVAKAVTEGGPEITKEIAALAKHGMLRASGDEKGMLHAMSNLLHKYDTAARVIMARRYDNLVKAGWADDSMAGKRAFVMQVGEYNRRLMPWLDAKMRDYGLAPFIVAGRTFNRLGSRLVFGEPGFKNAEGKVPLKARAAMLTPWLTLLATATLANLLLSGSMFGRKGTPIGAIDLGPDHDSADGKRKTLDLLQMSGLRRGLRRTGLGAVVNGVKDGQGINDISKGMIEDSVTANAHPFMGPGLGFTIEALTGKRLDLRTGWTNPSETRAYDGGKQYLENARSALKHLNSLGYAIGKPAIGGAMNAAGMTMPVEDASGKGILGYGKDVLSTLVKTPASAVGYKETSSPALSLARKLQREHMPALPPDEAKQAQFMEKRGIYDQLRNKDQSGLAEGLKNGSIAPSQVKDILSRANAHPLVNAAHGLPLEQVQRIAALADEKEQAVLAPLIAHKTVNAAKAQMKKPMRTIPTR